MDRLAEYLKAFADLLGPKHNPVFKGLRRGSTELLAQVPPHYEGQVRSRISRAKNAPESRPGKSISLIQEFLAEDGIKSAIVYDNRKRVLQTISMPVIEQQVGGEVRQAGSVDGVITGVVGADDTMHVHLRDLQHHDLRLVVRDEDLARSLLMRFRNGLVRLHVEGAWCRTEAGWMPKTGSCAVKRFEILDDASPVDVFAALSAISGNGWHDLEDPISMWRDLRGLQ